MTLTKVDLKFLRTLINRAKRSRCIRAQVGALIVKDGKILTSHDNSPHSKYDCRVIGCIRDRRQIPSGSQREVCYGMCAEQYAIAKAAATNIPTHGATLYVTSHPCRICEGLIVESGIKRVVYIKGYPDILPRFAPLRDYNIKVVHAKEFEKEKHVKKTHHTV